MTSNGSGNRNIELGTGANRTPMSTEPRETERSRRAGCPAPDPQVFFEKDEFQSLATSSIDCNSLQLTCVDVAMDSATVPITKPTRIIE